MITRRTFLKLSVTGAGLFLLTRFGSPRAFAAIPGGTLNLKKVSKYQMPLIIPPAMPRTGEINVQGAVDYYEIAVRQFQQQILPPPLPPTTVWSYGSANHSDSFNYPAFTIEATWHKPARVKWINDLKDPVTGNYLPHLLPVDPTLHWANPPGGTDGRDMRPTFTETPGPYTGPVPIVTHLHGGHSSQESDGYAEAWYLPAADNIPAGYATEGTGTTASGTSKPAGCGLATGHGGVPTCQRPARDHDLVSRPHARHDALERLRRPRGFLSVARRAGRQGDRHTAGTGTGARRPAGHEILRDTDRDPGPLLQQGRLAVLSGQPQVLR
jgi:hypothetical protein